MTVYSYAQMMGLWINAGGSRATAPIAAAIGEAESGGNSDALNPNDNHGTQSSYGIWQISNGTHAPPSPNWADPAINAQLAIGKYKGAGNSFRPWGTYDSGAYRTYLSTKTTPDTNTPGSPTAISAQLAAAHSKDCLVGFGGVPGTSLFNDLFGSGGNVGAFCLLTKSNMRGWLAMGSIVFGAAIAGVGLALIFGASLRDIRSGQQVIRVIVTGAKAGPPAKGSSRSGGGTPPTPSGGTGQPVQVQAGP